MGLEAADKAIQLKPDYMEAITYRGLLLRVLAAIEKDAGKQKDLLKDADAMQAKATGDPQAARRGRREVAAPTLASASRAGDETANGRSGTLPDRPFSSVSRDCALPPVPRQTGPRAPGRFGPCSPTPAVPADMAPSRLVTAGGRLESASGPCSPSQARPARVAAILPR